MQLSKSQISALLTEVARQEDGFNEILRIDLQGADESGTKVAFDSVQRLKEVGIYSTVLQSNILNVLAICLFSKLNI